MCANFSTLLILILIKRRSSNCSFNCCCELCNLRPFAFLNGFTNVWFDTKCSTPFQNLRKCVKNGNALYCDLFSHPLCEGNWTIPCLVACAREIWTFSFYPVCHLHSPPAVFIKPNHTLCFRFLIVAKKWYIPHSPHTTGSISPRLSSQFTHLCTNLSYIETAF